VRPVVARVAVAVAALIVAGLVRGAVTVAVPGGFGVDGGDRLGPGVAARAFTRTASNRREREARAQRSQESPTQRNDKQHDRVRSSGFLPGVSSEVIGGLRSRVARPRCCSHRAVTLLAS